VAGSELRVLDILASVTPLASLSERDRRDLEGVSKNDALALVRYAYLDLKNNPNGVLVLQELLARSRQSEFPLSEWITQIIRVYRWLEGRGQRAALEDVIEYTSCAFDGSSLTPGHQLDWYLDSYGFSRGLPV